MSEAFAYSDTAPLDQALLDASFGGMVAASLTALRALSRWAPAPAVQALGTPAGFAVLLGQAVPGDMGAPQIWRWDPTSSAADDGATIINPVDAAGAANQGAGRWLLTAAAAPPVTQAYVTLVGATQTLTRAASGSTYVVSNGGVGPIAANLPAAATLGNKWSVTLINADASANLVLAPASGLIAGAATYTIGPGESATIGSDGSNFQCDKGANITGAELQTNKGQPNGYAGLDASGEIAAALVPSETADQLMPAAGLSDSDEVLLRQSTSSLYRAQLAALRAYVYASLATRHLPVAALAAPAAIEDAQNGSIVQITSAGTITLDPNGTSDGLSLTLVNVSTGIVTVQAGAGAKLAPIGATGLMLPSVSIDVKRYTPAAGIPIFQLAGGSPAPQLSINQVAGVLVGAAVAVSGNYVNALISALDYSTNGGTSWSAAASPTIGSGAYAFQITGLALGTYQLMVRDHNTQTTVAGPMTFVVGSAEQITVGTPANVLADQEVAISGTYLGTTAAIQASFDGSGSWSTIVASPTGGTYIGYLPAPAIGTHSVSVRFADNSASATAPGTFQVIGIPIISVATPADVAAFTPVALTGTYGYDSPSGIDWSIDGIVWNHAVDPTIAGGNWSISVDGLVQDYYRIFVRLADYPSATAETGWFAVGEALEVTLPSATAVAGSIVTGSALSTAAETVTHVYVTFDGVIDRVRLAFYANPLPSSFAPSFQAPALAGTYYVTFYVSSSITCTVPLTLTEATEPIVSLDEMTGTYYADQAFTVTGQYGGGTPSALEYAFDSVEGSWYANGTATINGDGTFSLAVPAQTALAAGPHDFFVRFLGEPGSASARANGNTVTFN